jgi:hypothetical protein
VRVRPELRLVEWRCVIVEVGLGGSLGRQRHSKGSFLVHFGDDEGGRAWQACAGGPPCVTVAVSIAQVPLDFMAPKSETLYDIEEEAEGL